MTNTTAHRGKIVSEAEFRRMWLDDSMTTTQIGAALGISQSAACQRAKARSLPPRRYGPAPLISDTTKLADLWKAGVSVADIAARTGVCERTVRTMARKLGLPQRRGGKRSTTSLAVFAEMQLAARMAEAARIERAEWWNAEMIDGHRDRDRRAA